MDGISPSVRAIAAYGSRLYIGGFFEGLNGQPRRALAEIDASSGSISGWHSDVDVHGSVSSLVTRGSELLVAGSFTAIERSPGGSLAAIPLDTRPIDPYDGGSLALICMPNPTTGPAELRFTLRSSQRVTLTVFDLQGRRVKRDVMEALPQGPNTIAVDLGRLRNGWYLCRVDTGESVGTRRILVTH